MKAWMRGGFLGGLVLSSLGLIWVLGHRQTRQQPVSLRPAVDRLTEAQAAVNRVGQELARVSLSEEVALGQKLAQQEPSLTASRDGFLKEQAFLDAVVARLARAGGLRRPEMPYRIGIVDTACPNAFALPGGRIYITTAMLACCGSEAELAVILGHEMAHVDLKHCIGRFQYELKARKLGGKPLEAMAGLGARLLMQGYQDEQELEADRWGASLAARAGYHPQAFLRVMSQFEEGTARSPRSLPGEAGHALMEALEDYFQSHPPMVQRKDDLDRALREMGLDPARQRFYLGVRNRREWLPWDRHIYPEEFIQGPLKP